MKKIIVISGKDGKLVNSLVDIFVNIGYTFTPSFLERPKTNKWVLANVTKYSMLSVNPTVLQFQEAGIKATVHYIDINSWGTYGANIDFDF
jgi:hypothetical protein